MRTARFRPVTLATCLALSACGSSGGGGGTFSGGGPQPLDANYARNVTIAQAKGALGHSDGTLGFLDGAQVLHDFLGAPKKAPCDPQAVDCYPSADTIEVELDKALNDVESELDKRLFAPAQLESSQATEVVYKLAPATFCQTSNTADDCFEFLSDVPVRVRFTAPAAGALDAVVQFGDERVPLLKAEIREKSLTAILWLDVQEAAEATCKANKLACLKSVVQRGVTSLFGKDTLPVDLQQSTGLVRATWTNLGTLAASLKLEVLNPVQITYGYDGQTYSYSLGTGSVTAVAQGADQRLDLAIQLGAVSAAAPYHLLAAPLAKCAKFDQDGFCMEDKPLPKLGNLVATLPGLTATAKLTRGQGQVRVEGLGLGAGTAKLQLGNTVLAAVTLTGPLAVGVAGQGQDYFTFDVLPFAEAKLTLAPSAVAADLDLDSALRDETLTGKLAGAAQPKVLMMQDDGVKVLDGKLELSSSGAGGPALSVAVGQCLVPAEGDKANKGLLGLVAVGPCPAP